MRSSFIDAHSQTRFCAHRRRSTLLTQMQMTTVLGAPVGRRCANLGTGVVSMGRERKIATLTITQPLAGKSAVDRFNAGKTGRLPGITREPVSGVISLIFELKIDGFRALAHIEDGQGQLISGNGNFFRGFADLAKWIAEHLRIDSAVLDGEIACVDNDGRPVFRDLLFIEGPSRRFLMKEKYLSAIRLSG